MKVSRVAREKPRPWPGLAERQIKQVRGGAERVVRLRAGVFRARPRQACFPRKASGALDLAQAFPRGGTRAPYPLTIPFFNLHRVADRALPRVLSLRSCSLLVHAVLLHHHHHHHLLLLISSESVRDFSAGQLVNISRDFYNGAPRSVIYVIVGRINTAVAINTITGARATVPPRRHDDNILIYASQPAPLSH